MSKIEEILQTYTGCKGTCECGCGLVEAMKEFGKICFEAGRDQSMESISDDGGDSYYEQYEYKYYEYEDFLKEIEDERRN